MPSAFVPIHVFEDGRKKGRMEERGEGNTKIIRREEPKQLRGKIMNAAFIRLGARKAFDVRLMKESVRLNYHESLGSKNMVSSREITGFFLYRIGLLGLLFERHYPPWFMA